MLLSRWPLSTLDLANLFFVWDLGTQHGAKWGSQVASDKEPACQCRRHTRCVFDPWVRKIPWKRAWQPTAVLLYGESHGHRSLTGYLVLQKVRQDWSQTRMHVWCQVLWRNTKSFPLKDFKLGERSLANLNQKMAISQYSWSLNSMGGFELWGSTYMWIIFPQ